MRLCDVMTNSVRCYDTLNEMMSLHILCDVMVFSEGRDVIISGVVKMM